MSPPGTPPRGGPIAAAISPPGTPRRVVLLAGRSTGGIGTHVTDLAGRLRAFGLDVRVVTAAPTADRFGLVDALPWWPSPDKGAAASVADLRRLRALLKSADVVHAHGHQAGLLAVLAGAALPCGPALVVSLHNAVLRCGGTRPWLLAAAERLVVRRADLVTGASSDLVARAVALGARCARLAPVPSPRVPELLRLPVLDADQRQALAGRLLHAEGLTATGPLVVTISRIAPQKDLRTLVDAAAALGTPATWVVGGDGDAQLLAGLRRRAADLGAAVHFLGPVRDPVPWLRAAEAFVLTSTWEARALVVQEALAAGVPVVCSDTGGLRDLVLGAGRLVPVGDAPGFARTVGEVLGDRAERHTGSVVARARAAAWPDGEATARRWVQWYAQARRMT